MAGTAKNVVAFNDQAVAKKARAKVARQIEWKIEGVPGLSLAVKPSGVATYFVRYQAGKGARRQHRREALGRHGLIDLAEAKSMALDVMSRVAKGGDPVAESEASANALTFRQLFEQRKAKDGARASRTLDDYQRSLALDVFPELGDLPAGEITGEQIAGVLETIEARSKHAAHKARSAIGSTYRWAVKRRKVRGNPTIGLGFTVQSRPRNRVLTDSELRTLWQAIDTGPGLSEAMRLIMKLAVLTGQRESEVAGALTAELTLDAANPKWRIPSERMKRKNREQIVPLSIQAVALFRRAVELSNGSPYVFPADLARVRIGHDPRKPHINGESVSRAMARLREREGLDDARVHDLRKTVTTWLRETKLVSSDVCDLILHHARKGVTASHYDFSTLEGPVRKAMQDWADHVEAVVNGKAETAANVTPLPVRA